jgi:hypothetical protein
MSSSAAGEVTLTIPPLAALLYRPEAAVPATAPQKVALKVVQDDLSSLRAVTVTVGGEPASVAVAVRRDRGTAWLRVGVDASPPYRVFLDPRRYRRGETLHVVAVARSLGGQTVVSQVVTIRLPRTAS